MRRVVPLVLVLSAAACDADRPVVPLEQPAGPLLPGPTRPRFPNGKLDLLLVVDGAPGMADAQSELARRVPELLVALTDPTPDPKTGRPDAFTDVHVGVISSSLGSFGTSACAPSVTGAHGDDRAHLLPRAGEALASGCPALDPATPITWVLDAAKDPFAKLHGVAGAKTLETAVSCVIDAVKDDGCVYPAPWEAAYRFLVDPEPYARAEVACTFGPSGDECGAKRIEVSGVDEDVLRQRAAFLRPDSVLAVVIVSNRNDASLKPAGLNWVPWAYPAGHMERGWSSCANVPDDFEPETPADYAKLHEEHRCYSCFEDASDPGCKVPWATAAPNADVDARSLRAFQQVQRFGYGFLYGRQRYVDAFSRASLISSDGKPFANPIFRGGIRDPNTVVVATIVGLPKGLVSDASGSVKDLGSDDWDKLVGPIGKRDPHMIESIGPREGLPKYAGDRAADVVNGGDRDVPNGDDLQHACITPLPMPEPSAACADGAEDPACEGDGTRAFSAAYPGLRHVRIARALGATGLVASICDASLRPAMVQLVEKLKAANASCLDTVLPADDGGRVNCLLHEALAPDSHVGERCEALGAGVCTPGAEPCRLAGSSFPPLPPALAAAQLRMSIPVLRSDGSVEYESVAGTSEGGNVYVMGSDRKKRLVCELLQLTGRAPDAVAEACVNDPAWAPDESVAGWCYSQSPDVVGEHCSKRGAPTSLRFAGAAEPRAGSTVQPACAR